MKITLHLPDHTIELLQDIYREHGPAGDLPSREVQIEQAIQMMADTFTSMEPSEEPPAEPSEFMTISAPVNPQEVERFFAQSFDPLPDTDDVEINDFAEPPSAADGKVSWQYIYEHYSHVPVIERLSSEPDMQEKIEAVRTALTGLPEDLWEAESTQQVLARIVNRPV